MSLRIGLNTVRHNFRNISNTLRSVRSVRQYKTNNNNTQTQNLGDRLLHYYFRIGVICGGSAGTYMFFTKQAEIARGDLVFGVYGVCIDTLESFFEAVFVGGITALFWPLIPIGTATYYYRTCYPLQLSESTKSSKS